MPTSASRLRCPIVRVPLDNNPKKYMRCPECDRKWPAPEVPLGSDVSLCSIRTPRRRPSPMARLSSGGIPMQGRVYPPKHSCSNHDRPAPPEKVNTEQFFNDPPRRARARPASASRLQAPREPEPDDIHPKQPQASDVSVQRSSLSYWDVPSCSRNRSVWSKIRRMFSSRRRRYYDDDDDYFGESMKIPEVPEPEVKRGGTGKTRRRRRKRSSVTWSRTPSVVFR